MDLFFVHGNSLCDFFNISRDLRDFTLERGNAAPAPAGDAPRND